MLPISARAETPRIEIPLRRKSLPEAFPIKASDNRNVASVSPWLKWNFVSCYTSRV